MADQKLADQLARSARIRPTSWPGRPGTGRPAGRPPGSALFKGGVPGCSPYNTGCCAPWLSASLLFASSALDLLLLLLLLLPQICINILPLLLPQICIDILLLLLLQICIDFFFCCCPRSASTSSSVAALQPFCAILFPHPTVSIPNMTPFEAFYGSRPSISHLRIFGCRAYTHTPNDTR